jgi:hypothetical protein
VCLTHTRSYKQLAGETDGSRHVLAPLSLHDTTKPPPKLAFG